jgi:hypothetical protein
MTHTKSFKLGAMMATLIATGAAHADDALTISGKLWAQYSLNLTDGAGSPNGFDVTRAFVQAKYKFDPTWSAVVLLDHDRSKESTWAYVRNAYVQAGDVVGEKSNFRFGLQPTLYIPLVESALKTRWLGKTLADESKILSSQDGGVSLTGEASSMIRYGVEVHNGVEALDYPGKSGNGLAASAVVSVLPLADSESEFAKLGLTVSDTVFAAETSAIGTTKKTSPSANVITGALHLEHSLLDLALETVMKRVSKANTVGFGGTLNVKFEPFSVYVRAFTGNDAFKNSALKAKMLLTAGPTYSFVKDKVSTALLYETRSAVAANAKAQNTVYWIFAANF